MGRLVTQPLVWFVIISLSIFGLDNLIPEGRDEIFVSAAQKDRIALLWKTQTGKDASIQELDSLVKNWIEEEVLFRQALRLGLDQDVKSTQQGASGTPYLHRKYPSLIPPGPATRSAVRSLPGWRTGRR